MSITINVNGLTLCHKDSGGVVKNTLPDMCKTPPDAKPLPYDITSFSKDLVKGTKTITADGGNMCANLGSEFSCCYGDEAGSLLGVASGTHMAEATWMSYSPDVFLESNAACRLTDMMWMNHANTVSMAGLSQANLKDPKLQILCEIFCEVRDEGHKARKNGKRFNYSNRAKELAEKPRYANRLKKLGDFAPEKSMTALIKKGGLGNTGRKLMSKAAVQRRMMKEMKEQAMKQVAKRVAGRLVLKFIPYVGAAVMVYDIYDTAKTLKAVASEVDNILKQFDSFRIRPDMAELGPNGEIKEIFDYKFDYPYGGKDTMSDSQNKLYTAKTGKKPKVIDQELCMCD